MAINKKLIHFKSKEKFNEELANANIKDTSIVFIQDSKEIWTHQLFYATPLTVEEIEVIVANSPTTEELLANIAAETSAREKAIEDTTTELTELITLELNRAQSAEETLTTNLSNEITRSTAQDEAHDAAIAKEVSDRETAITTEVNDRNNAIKVETDRAVAAEGTLQSNINTLDNELDTEVSRATNAEQALQTSIDTEVSRAKAAEAELDGKITNHTTITDAALALKADKADTYTKAQVDQKVSGSYKVKGSSTFENLPTEGNVVGDVYNITNIFTLDDVEYPVGTNVVYTEEGWDALSGVFDTTKLEGDIQTVADDITKETVRAEAAEAALSTSIQIETSNREAANLTLQSNIDSVNTALSEEVSRAKAAEQLNASDITTLAGRVTINETKLGVVQGDENTTGSINKALKDAKDYTDTTASTLRSELSSTIEGLDATISGSSANVTVEVTETDGKLINVAVSQSDIASAKGLSDEVTRATNAESGLNSRLSVVETNYVTTNTELTIGGIKTFSNQLVSTVAEGTTPISVLSTTVCSNLNADMLDGIHLDLMYSANTGSYFGGTTTKWGVLMDIVNNTTGTVDTSIILLTSVYSPYPTSSAIHGSGLFQIMLRGNNVDNISQYCLNWLSGYNDISLRFIATFKKVEGKLRIRIYGKAQGWTYSSSVKLLYLTGWGVNANDYNVIKYIHAYEDEPDLIFDTIPEDETIIPIKSTLIENEPYDWYGVSWSENSSDPTCTRIGNMAMHRSLPILSAMKRYGIRNNYFAKNKIDEFTERILPMGSFNEVSFTSDSNTLSSIADGDTTAMISIFTKIPEFWYIDDYVASTKTHNLKISQTAKAGWLHHKEAYVSTYEGFDDGTYYKSIKGVYPSVSTTRELFRTRARANGYEGESKWNIYTYEEHRAICHLFLVEYATRNCQAPVNSSLTSDGFRLGGLGSGCTTGKMNNTYSFIPTGITDSLGNGSGQVAYTASNGTTYYANRYRGIENPFGHVWKHCDDVISVYNGLTNLRAWYKCEDPSQFATNKNSAYRPICSRAVPTNGYKKEIAATINCDFFAEFTGGSKSTYWCDYNYDNTDASEHCLLIGGASNDGDQAGLFYLNSYDGVSISTALVGSRLTYLPWAK